MHTRTSIELHPDGCRVVVIRPATTAGAEPRVLRVVASAADGSEASTVTAALARLRRRHRLPRLALVTLWGLRSSHHLIQVPASPASEVVSAALARTRKAAAALARRGEGTTVAVKDGGLRADGVTRDASVVAVSNADVRDHLQPVLDAGFVVTGVTTPALALASLARQRREPAGAAVAYVALNPGATCLAIARDGVLLFSREVAWGYVSAADAGAAATRVVTGLQRLIQQFMTASAIPVAAMRLAGDAGALHGLATPLSQALGIKVDAVEPLTTLDTDALSQPADTFAADAVALRLVIAAAADRVPAVNLLPASLRAPRRRYAAAAGIAAGVATALFLAGCYWRDVPLSWF